MRPMRARMAARPNQPSMQKAHDVDVEALKYLYSNAYCRPLQRVTFTMSYRLYRLNVALRDNVIPGFIFKWRAILNHVPDAHAYRPTFEPWLLAEFQDLYQDISRNTLLNAERAWLLYSFARQSLNVGRTFLEAGVYRGGTARLLRRVLDQVPGSKALHLFDTFSGMPETDPRRDRHRQNDFGDTSIEAVSTFVGHEEWITYHKGVISDTFHGLDELAVAFAHIDVDIYRSVLDCCRLVYPCMVAGGIMLIDDYGLPSCSGARQAVDEFFADKPEFPIVFRTAQAAVICTGTPA
jgi:O-methyltransferase